MVISRRWCHNFQSPTIEHFGFRKNLPVAVLELVDYQVHLADCGINNGTFICNRFIDHFKRIDPNKSITDVIMFDGASNVHIAG